MDGSIAPRSGYDIVGDLHGYAARLESLLTAMSYAKRDGVWSHPERRAIFVGDYVDRAGRPIGSWWRSTYPVGATL
jgi:hypothetical protein